LNNSLMIKKVINMLL